MLRGFVSRLVFLLICDFPCWCMLGLWCVGFWARVLRCGRLNVLVCVGKALCFSIYAM